MIDFNADTMLESILPLAVVMSAVIFPVHPTLTVPANEFEDLYMRIKGAKVSSSAYRLVDSGRLTSCHPTIGPRIDRRLNNDSIQTRCACSSPRDLHSTIHLRTARLLLAYHRPESAQ